MCCIEWVLYLRMHIIFRGSMSRKNVLNGKHFPGICGRDMSCIEVLCAAGANEKPFKWSITRDNYCC